jgi:hypothetical protein
MRRSTQFSLRALLLGFTAIAIVLGLYDASHRKKERCLRRLRELDASICFDYEWSPKGAFIPDARPPGNDLLKRILGEHYAAHPQEVLVGESRTAHEFTDADAALLTSLSEVKWLSLQGTRVTDEGLLSVHHLKKLERLDLEGSRVTPDGVRQIKAVLPNLDVYSDFPEVDGEPRTMTKPANSSGRGSREWTRRVLFVSRGKKS